MKIIGGEFKGRRIDMPRGEDVRPTPDRVREAVFNIIKDKVEGASVLDLFAGSGSFGIEALSRGAQKVTFVDAQKRCVNNIRGNLKRLPIGEDRIKIIQNDALKVITKLSDSKIRFDILFLDPPYYGDWVKKCLLCLGRYDILNRSSSVICEHFKKDIVPEEIEGFKRIRSYRYGDTVLSFYRREKEDEKGGVSRDV